MCTFRDAPREELAEQLSAEAVLIAGCGCALVGITDEGGAVYSYELLLYHYHEHENFKALDDDDDDTATTAREWIEQDILRAAPPLRGVMFRIEYN